MNYFLAWVASVALVFLKSFQQQSVTHERYRWIPPVSYGLAGFELYLWSRAPTADWGIWLAIGTGAWMGSIAAILVHRKVRRAGRVG